MLIQASEDICNTSLLPDKFSGPTLLWGINVKFYFKMAFNFLRLF